MFCPKCGTLNGEELSFCRSCGENLELISQALNRNPSLVLAHKLGEAIKRNPTIQLSWLKNQKRRGAGELLSGSVTLFSMVWFIVLGRGNPEFAYGVISAISCYLITLGIWDLRDAFKPSETTANHAGEAATGASAPKQLDPLDTSKIAPVESVIESTTKNLKQPVRRR